MKVAFILERYDVALGGAELLVSESTSALARRGLAVSVLAAKGRKQTENIHILCGGGSGRTSLSSFSKAIRNHLATNQYDIIHSVIPLSFTDVYQPPGGSFPEAVLQNAASYQNKFIAWYKNATSFINWRRTEMLRAEKQLCANPDGPVVAALSNYVRQQFKTHYNLPDDRIAVIPNGVETDYRVDNSAVEKLRTQIFNQLKIKPADNPLLLLFSANNFGLKGLDALIKAMALLNQSALARPAYLLVAGSGKIDKYHSLAQKSGVSGKILFLGHIKHTRNVLAMTDISVLPTFYDPSSRAILEALAVNQPVITTRFNGAADLFTNNRHGKILDNPEDFHSLAEAIRYFADANNLKNASQAIAADNLKEKVSIARLAAQTETLYNIILDKRRRK